MCSKSIRYGVSKPLYPIQAREHSQADSGSQAEPAITTKNGAPRGCASSSRGEGLPALAGGVSRGPPADKGGAAKRESTPPQPPSGKKVPEAFQRSGKKVVRPEGAPDIRCAYLHGLDGCLMQGERVREEHHDHSSRAYLHVSDGSLMQGERARAELSSYLREPLCTVQPRG